MATSTFDPAAYKETTRAQWQEAAEAWHRWGPTLEAVARRGDGADARPGPDSARERRCSTWRPAPGGQTIAAARRVGPDGRVVATDISPMILAYAADAAREAGLENVETREMDGEALAFEDDTFDAVISRVGLIYFPDQQGALREIHRVLRPGGRLSAIVYSTADRNQFFSIPVGIIRRIAGLPAPAPGLPGPFSLGNPGVLDAAYENAGFEDVDVRAVDAPVRFPTAADCVRFERESFGALHAMLAGVTEAEREQAWSEIETELGQFESSDGFEGPCQLLVGGARRGS